MTVGSSAAEIGGRSVVRSLVVARWAPWPSVSGTRQRTANVIAALGALGPVDVFLLADEPDAALSPPPDIGVERVGVAPRSLHPRRPAHGLRTLFLGAHPIEVQRRVDVPARDAFAAWIDGSYDVAWYGRIEAWLAVGDLVSAPAIVDYDDLRDEFVWSRLRSTWPDRQVPPRTHGRARSALSARIARADARSWGRLQRDVARQVASVVVCSELDRARLGVGNAAIVANGVDIPVRPVGGTAEHARPTLGMQGALIYTPNVDAARLLVRDVAPRVRSAVPDVAVRLVGRYDHRLAELAGPDVTMTGEVPDMLPELAAFDVVAVPLRQGAGTRIKVLEALAHRLPVVATSLAVEGLDLVDGEHVLVADDPDAFAAACIALLTDCDLRARLVDAGERLVRDRYAWARSQEQVAALARQIAPVRPEG